MLSHDTFVYNIPLIYGEDLTLTLPVKDLRRPYGQSTSGFNSKQTSESCRNIYHRYYLSQVISTVSPSTPFNI